MKNKSKLVEKITLTLGVLVCAVCLYLTALGIKYDATATKVKAYERLSQEYDVISRSNDSLIVEDKDTNVLYEARLIGGVYSEAEYKCTPCY